MAAPPSPIGSFCRADRLLRSREFEHVLRHGRRTLAGQFVVLTAPCQTSPTRHRLGITVSKQVGNAVVRNHVKRQVREWFRAARDRLGAATDIVVIGRSGAGQLAGVEIAAILNRATTQAGS